MTHSTLLLWFYVVLTSSFVECLLANQTTITTRNSSETTSKVADKFDDQKVGVFGWLVLLTLTFLFLGGIAGYLYYFFKVDKMYARKRRRKSKSSSHNESGKVNNESQDKPKSAIDAAAAVVSAVFNSPQSLVPGVKDKTVEDKEELVEKTAPSSPIQMDELSNKPLPIPLKPLPATTSAYNKPLEVDKLPPHLFGGRSALDTLRTASTTSQSKSPPPIRRTGTDEMLNLEKLPSTIPYPEEKKDS